MKPSRAWPLLVATIGAVLLAPTAQAAFPGENGKILFVRKSGFDTRAIWVMDADGTNQAPLTGSEQESFNPTWSPDGTKIAFVRAGNVWVMNADGTGQHNITSDPADANSEPAWSPDGTRLVYSRVVRPPGESVRSQLFVINADGTGATRLTFSGQQFQDRFPAWSPDGQKIAFHRHGFPKPPDNPFAAEGVAVLTVNADGTGETVVAAVNRTDNAYTPDWSPDGTKIVFARGFENDSPDNEVWSISADGTGEMQLTDNVTFDGWPVWAPDGASILLERILDNVVSPPIGSNGEIVQINPDGSGAANLTQDNAHDNLPDWQPIPRGYPRPKGATPFRVSLVPAYIACGASNRTHGPPLAFGSCNPPQQRSGVLTVGTPDASGTAANFVGAVRLGSLIGNPATPADEADVTVGISITDVRCRQASAACPGGALSDYTGRLLALPISLRVTDRDNTPHPGGAGPGTGETQVKVPVACAATVSTTIGATCGLSTTVDSLIPGAIKEGRRTIWELGQVHVRDAGPNGTGFESPACPPDCGDGDETLFLRQGVFVP